MMDGSLTRQLRAVDDDAPARQWESIETTPINQLMPTSVDSQTWSAWVGSIPLIHADEASLYHAFAKHNLGHDSIVKVTVQVKGGKTNGSWALIALATVDDLRAVLAAQITLEDAAGEKVVLQIKKSEVGKQLDTRARRMSYEGNLSAVSMAHVIGTAHEMQSMHIARKTADEPGDASTAKDTVEHLSVWVGNIPAEHANSAAMMKIFTQHGCDPLFCTPRVKPPPKTVKPHAIPTTTRFP